MRALRELQRSVYRAILTDRKEQLAPLLVGADVPAATRLRVYVNNLRETARKTLAAGFPVVHALVGAPCFRNLARMYVSRYPSPSGNLAAFGASFPHFLAELYEETEFEYLTSVAEIEWACVECEIASDATPLDAGALQGVPESELPDLRFEVHPAMRALRVGHGAFAIWREHQGAEAGEIVVPAAEQGVLVYRSGESVIVQPVADAALRFVDCLRAGESLLAAQTAAAMVDGEFDPAQLLRDLYEAGLFVGLVSERKVPSTGDDSNASNKTH